MCKYVIRLSSTYSNYYIPNRRMLDNNYNSSYFLPPLNASKTMLEFTCDLKCQWVNITRNPFTNGFSCLLLAFETKIN